jgi:glutamate synthase (NADPH/NADH) large chain
LLEKHYYFTSSEAAKNILDNWKTAKKNFVKVYPSDYHRMRDLISEFREAGTPEDQAIEKAFYKATAH